MTPELSPILTSVPTAEEHRLLAAAETDDESRMAESRAELNKLYKQYIYV